jgi:predicted CoA-substrate-specific enzyme activase
LKSLGICIGATTISVVAAQNDNQSLIWTTVVTVHCHKGKPREALLDLFNRLSASGDHYSRIAVTGRNFRNSVNLTTLSEPEAIERALLHLNGKGMTCTAVISAGGETFLTYVLGKDGRISSVQTGNKCASGTGEFFMQQIQRMGFTIEEAVAAAGIENSYKVSSRCSVFCKTDCTHAANKGISKERIAAGLCEMMAGKIIEILKNLPRQNLMLIGGTSQNTALIDHLKKEIQNLHVPPEAPYFEALGAALWALDHETMEMPSLEGLFAQEHHSFSFLPALKNFMSSIDFKSSERGSAGPGDRCIVGLDVGSTTTKAVLLRIADDRMLASVYLRTNGDPVQASRACYGELLSQMGPLSGEISILGLGVTGSGRQIAGLHAMTDGIVNEIIAHAKGAVFFDPRVDTIFEIGGQDAKYTYIKNGIPTEYAMNEACSAGTGSFLEEAARESMGVEMAEIGEMAVRGQKPPNFNDQCAAFISSDIKTAVCEGVSREDIVAGLVYSTCMNYTNRVKGNRPVGNRIFMQGGVCYNHAVPLAMASLTGKKIIVPPDPGLMGAFGVALEIKQRLGLGLIKEKSFSLQALRDRQIDYGNPFICGGGKEKCDRKCEIARIKMDGETYPFGGGCNRWYNLRFKIDVDTEKLDYIRNHEQQVFHNVAEDLNRDPLPDLSEVIGINKSFLVNSFYPLYAHFFRALGFKVKIADKVDQEGIDLKRAAFCYPAEIAHGYLYNLLTKKPNYLFLPQMKGMYVENGCHPNVTCPISQGEPYYLSSAFKDNATFKSLLNQQKVLIPVIDFSDGFDAAERGFLDIGMKLGRTRANSRKAFSKALCIQRKMMQDFREKGTSFLQELESDPRRYAVAIMGRSYNACVTETNMGVPQKFTSRGIAVIPSDFLPFGDEPIESHMYWSTGQLILKSAAFVEKHPQIFGCFITNFSCGPDSFLVEYVKHIMGSKPFLILELDSHAAHAGLETRIDAFLDIIRNHMEMKQNEQLPAIPKTNGYRQAYFDRVKKLFIDSTGGRCALYDSRVNLLIPSMGKFSNEAFAAIFRSTGIRTTALPPADDEVLKLGRSFTSCKECLPLLLTVGSLLQYVKKRKHPDELLVFFMPTAQGPCRFGQYSPFISHLISSLEIENVALLSLDGENSYSGLEDRNLTVRLLLGLVVGDIMQDVYSALLVNAVEKDGALAAYDASAKRIRDAFEKPMRFSELLKILALEAQRLKKVPVKKSLADIPAILITGEIFVRLDDLSRRYLVERLAEKGFMVKVSGIMEWIYYTDWCCRQNNSKTGPGVKESLMLRLRNRWMKFHERRLMNIMAKSGLLRHQSSDVERMIRYTRHLINPQLIGEAILTVGASLSEVPKHYCGVIAIGPFGCMPNRIAESILSREMGAGWQDMARRQGNHLSGSLEQIEALPFLSIESDGNAFPQIIGAKLEIFMLQAVRLFARMKNRSCHS